MGVTPVLRLARVRGEVSSLEDDSTRLGRGRERSTGVAVPEGSGEKLPGARGPCCGLAGCIVEALTSSMGSVTSWQDDKIGPLLTASFRGTVVGSGYGKRVGRPETGRTNMR